tara:strand:+ start:496 stop:1929 length:1434 start_codon:yes stop_codon:yes gene_type:complete
VASTIQIKRGSGAPGSLADGELAVDTGNKILYVGNSASGVVEISRNTIDGVDISDGSNTVAINAASGTETYTLTLPGNDGDASQVLTTNGSGVLSWTTPSGTLSASGSPADGQVSVWTSGTALEGDAALTFTTTSDTLNIGASNDGTLTIGGVTIINNAGSGAVALSGIDSIDATTEATIEAAIDTLSNLTSIGTLATGVWQATDIAVAHGGTGASSAGDARTNLGLVIGTNVQAYDADLAAIAGLTSAANKIPYFTGSGAAAVADFTAFGRSIVDDADAGAVRTTIGVDAAGTDNSTNVTLAGSLDYLTISGQEITRGAIVLTTDVSGTLPVGNGGTGATTLGDNRVLTGAGTSAISAEANMTFDGSTLAVTGDVNITGDLSVAGNTTITDTTTISVEDSMLKLASNNTNTDTVDIGFYGVYVDSGTKYAGIIRDASDGDGVFKVQAGFTSEPGVTANFGQGALAQLDAIIDGGTY